MGVDATVLWSAALSADLVCKPNSIKSAILPYFQVVGFLLILKEALEKNASLLGLRLGLNISRSSISQYLFSTQRRVHFN